MTYEEFESHMAEKFPEMFGEDCHYGGFAIGEGWYHIIELLCANIQSHLKWKEQNRQHEIARFNAREQGLDALIKLYQGESDYPRDWDIERAEETLANGVTIPQQIPPIVIEQIKEKFGGLRFYYQGGDDVVDGMVRMAESIADYTCETCGNKGERRNGGWIRTLCDTHEAEHKERLSKMRSEDDDE